MSLWGNKDLKGIAGTSLSVTNNSKAIVGTATTFTTDLKEGSFINISGTLYKVYLITDDTHLTLVTEYQGSTNATLSFTGTTTAPSALVIGNTYKITSVGTTTNWNTIAGTTGLTYIAGNIITVVAVGSGDGSTTTIPVFAQTAPTYVHQATQVLATALSKGTEYKILSAGTTDFTLIGAANSTVGTVFTATGAGTGTGIVLINHQRLDLSKIFFVSLEEAQLDSNRKKGIHGAGWWRLTTYVDSDGNTRYKSELLQEQSTSSLISNDANDDATIADTNPVITIGTQPAAQNTSGGAATFSVSATVSVVSPVATITYQWQKSVAGSTKFATVSGATSASLVLSGQTSANTGDRYRVVINTTPNAIAAVTSAPATLNFVS